MATITTFNFVENATSDQAGRASTEAENATRAASVECTYTSTGFGQHRLKTPVIFPVIFSSEPHFTSGCGTVKSAGGGYYHDPIGTAGIWQWEVDSRGYFLGAHLWVRVDIYPTRKGEDISTLAAHKAKLKGLAAMKTLHYLTFTGRAIKDIPSRGAVMTPHRVGL